MTGSVTQQAGGIADLKKARRSAPSGLNSDRLPPNSSDMERGVLGCILSDPNECMAKCIELGMQVESFYDLRHQVIYRIFSEMHDAREAIDLLTVHQKLKDAGMLDQIGGIPYLNAIQDSIPSAANVTYYAAVVLEKHDLRKMLQFCTSICGRIYEFEGEVKTLQDEFEVGCLKLRRSELSSGAADIKALQQELQEDYESAVSRRAPMGIQTGFTDLDRHCGGMMGQELIVIGGVPSSGKTTLALNIAARAAKSGIKVCIISMETSGKKLVHRFQSMLGEVDGSVFLRGDPTEADVHRMISGVSKVSSIRDNLIIHDNGQKNESQLASCCRRAYQAGARLFVLDYLQLLLTRGKDDVERATAASKCVKRIASELNVPFIVISSLRRQDASQKPRKPTMQDLRQSGQIEYDAEKILLLWCEDVTAVVRDVECNVAKCKDGMLGPIHLTMFADQYRMESASKVADADVPNEE